MPPAIDFLLAHWMRQNASRKKSQLIESNVTALSLSELQSYASETNPAETLINLSNPLGYGSSRGSPLLRTHIAETLYAPITHWGAENYAVATEPKSSQGEQAVDAAKKAIPGDVDVNVLPPLNAEDILVNTGTSGANDLVLGYLLGPGDHVIVQYPTYGALYEVPRRAGAEVSLWQSKEKNEWVPDVAELEHLVKENTKMLIMNNPNNPTGAVTPLSSLIQVVDFCKKHNLILFCDEIFRPLFHAPPSSNTTDPPPPSVLNLYERSIATGSLSKSFALPGLRIGWIATRMHNLLTAFASAADYTTIAVSALDDQVAAYALRSDVRRKILKRSHDICQENLQILDEFVKEWKGRVQWVRPQGAGTGFIKIAQPGKEGDWVDDHAFASELIEKTGLLLVPGGHCFSDDTASEHADFVSNSTGKSVDPEFRGYFRVALGNEPQKTRDALKVLGQFLKSSSE